MASTRRHGTARRFLVAMATAFAVVASPITGAAAQEAPEVTIYDIVFPVAGDNAYVDSWGAPRSDGRTHEGTDIFAAKGTPVVAAADGTVMRISVGDRAGRYMVVEHPGGWRTYYLHLNNDSADTDDGLGGAPAEGIAVGVAVKAGDVLDFVGDSGNAEGTQPHLHFEIHTPDGAATNPYPHLRNAQNLPFPAAAVRAAPAESSPTYLSENIAVVGQFDPGEGFAADVTVHNDVAYLSTWGRPQACPASGVRVIDVSNPTQPVAMSAIASASDFPGTSTDSVWVGNVATAAFTGDLAVVALRLCDSSETGRLGDTVRGLAVYDVTDPTTPTLLSTFDSGAGTQGIHEIDVVIRHDGSLLAAVTSLQSLRYSEGAVGDLRIVDLTDPASPIAITDWDLRRDGPTDEVDNMLTEVYDDLELHAHSAIWNEDGTALWVANWDGGVVLLDTADPTAPEFKTAFGFDPESEGNIHSVVLDVEADLLIRNDQDLVNTDMGRHSVGWGYQRFYDISDLGDVTELGQFATERSAPREDGTQGNLDGRYSAHNAVVADGVDYAAWYSDGLRMVDISNPTQPRELAWFIPPARDDPQGYWAAPDGTGSFAMVWGVAVSDGLIYVSDMNTGLWILRYDPPIPEGIATDGNLLR